MLAKNPDLQKQDLRKLDKRIALPAIPSAVCLNYAAIFLQNYLHDLWIEDAFAALACYVIGTIAYLFLIRGIRQIQAEKPEVYMEQRHGFYAFLIIPLILTIVLALTNSFSIA
jgi:membrane protein CcdC involved in cytochrome C biogenesis